MNSLDTIVVGGGLAGITAAVALAQAGQRVALLEADTILGGRASSAIDPVTGDAIAIGPHVLFSAYANMIKLLGILGTEGEIVWDRDRFATEVFGEREIVTRMSRLPAPLHFVPSLLGDPTLRNRDWLSNAPITLFVLSLHEEELLRLDQERAIDLLRQWGVNERYIHRFWRYLSLAIMNMPLEDCSAAALLRAYRRLVGRRGVRVGLPAGGLGDLFVPAAEKLLRKHGAEVRTGARAVLIEDAYRVTLESGETIQAPACVLAVPPHALHALLPREWRTGEVDATAALRSVPYISVYLWFDRKLTTLAFWSRRYDPKDLNLDFYDFSNIGPRGGASLVGSNIIGSDRVAAMHDEEIVCRTRAELTEFLPHAAQATLRHSVVHRIPMAIHAPFPGSESLRPTHHELRPRLLLAGDWLQTGLPASMESACFSGFRAAETILGRRGLVVEHRELGPLAAALGAGVRLLRHLKYRSGV